MSLRLVKFIKSSVAGVHRAAFDWLAREPSVNLCGRAVAEEAKDGESHKRVLSGQVSSEKKWKTA